PESTTHVVCYRLRFGMYDALGGRTGLEGVTATDPTSFRGDFSTLHHLGLEVRAAVRGILNRHPNAEIALLGHSRGGLAARAFSQKTSPERAKVVAMVTTGTPHRGSPLGRIYKYLRNHPRPNPATDWRVVDFLNGKTNCSNVIRIKNPDPLDVRRPTIDDLSSDSVGIRDLNRDIGSLPRTIKYGELRYPLLRLGVLADIPPQYSVFDRRDLSDICVQLTTAAEQTIVGSGHTADDYPGDGMVPEASQRYFNIPRFPAPLANRFSRQGRSFTVHTKEPEQSTDIDAILTDMMGAWWTTP
ncbi:MAG: esterase/lipase family protein, partial [Gammaproteobacteria bacterium]